MLSLPLLRLAFRAASFSLLLLSTGMTRMAVGQNAATCAADRAALLPLDQQIQTLQSAVVTPQQISAQTQLYENASTQRAKLIAKGTTDCAAACKVDRSLLTSLDNQLDRLLQQEQKNAGSGINPFPIQQQIKQLRTTIQGQAALESKDCAPFLDSRVPGNGIILPHYQILFVVYAPPGANGGKGVSSVDYGSGSMLESTVSASNSFSTDFKIASTFTGGAFGDDVSLGLSFDQSEATTKSSSADVKESISDDLKVPGPSADGIDHNSDTIYLLLNPAVHVSQSKTAASWSMGVNGAVAKIQFVYVSWLKQPATMPAGVLQQLQSAGIQPNDYGTILSADPFANGPVTIDTARFKQLTTVYFYEPPNSATQTPLSETHAIKDEEQNTTGNSVDTSSSLGVTVGVTVNAVFAKVSLSVSDTFTYKYDNSFKQTTDTSQSETITIGQPAFGYAGPTALYIYRDSLFQTYLFSLTPPPGDELLVTGTILSSTGAPERFADISLTAGGRIYRTTTNGNGTYHLVGQPPKSAQAGVLQVGSQQVGVMLGHGSITENLKLAEPLAPVSVRRF
ncbi:carboxypeptidase-like regulatory domain-containing protein [Terriglobus sp.]|uniref:carboxypeptidase-like regulatory domain-containing protein n=1 Tax=Terriglobus sp. TaxID=1889013 RepID=UPI003B00ED6B